MVLFTPKKLTFKRSKKQHQILAQTAYYQAGKIVVQTILPEQPPVALITLNTLGTTCSTSADTYIPIENIFNTQSCSFLESRLVSLYGGKAASLLIEYQQRLNLQIEDLYGNEMCRLAAFRRHNYNSVGIPHAVARVTPRSVARGVRVASTASEICRKSLRIPAAPLQRFASTATICNRWQSKEGLVQLRGQKLAKQKMDEKLAQLRKPKGGMRQRNSEETPKELCKRIVLTNCVNETKANSRASAYNTETKLINNVTECRTCFAGAGNNSFQSTLGNIEIQTATRLARIMVNYWNFYSLNKSSLYSIFKKDAPARQLNALHNKASINSINKLANFPIRKHPLASARVNPHAVTRVTPGAFANVNPFANTRVNHYLPQYFPLRGLQQRSVGSDKQLGNCAKQSPLRIASPYSVGVSEANISFPYKSSYKSSICTEHARGRVRLEDLSEDLSGVHVASTTSEICTKSRRIPAAPLRNPEGVSSASIATISNRWQSKEKFMQLKGHKQKKHLLQQHEESVAKELEAEGYGKRKYNVRVWGIKLKVKDKTLAKRWGNIIYKVATPRAKQTHTSAALKGSTKSSIEHARGGLKNNLYFAIAQSKNSVKICESSGTSNSSYNIQRLSIENIGNYSQLNNTNFQLINSLQFSNLQRDRFYPNWFRLYLPDVEATEFLKNVANYYFSLSLQTFTFPSTKFSYYSNAYPSGVTLLPFNFGKLGVNIANPFLTFLKKNTQKEKFIPTIISYTYCPPSILVNFTSDKSIHSRFTMNDLVRRISHTNLRFSMRVGGTAKNNYINTLLWKASASHYYKLYPRFNNFVIPPTIARVNAPAAAKVNSGQRMPPSGLTTYTSSSAIMQSKAPSNTSAALKGYVLEASDLTSSGARAKQTLDTSSSAYLPKGQLVKVANPEGGMRQRNSEGIVLMNGVNEMQQQKEVGFYEAGNFTLQAPGIMGVDYIKDPSFTKVEGMNSEGIVSTSSMHTSGGKSYPLNVPFSLLLENQIFPLNHNGFSIVEKELLYNALVNSSFAKAFYLINQNRQLLDFLVDYLLRFQILRQHQILYLFSTLLLGCNKTA